jgi:methylglutamate dehydrogenase subunit D
MLEARSAIGSSAFTAGQVTLSEGEGFTLTQVAGSDAALRQNFPAMPQRVGVVGTDGERTLLRLGPKQLWVIGPEPTQLRGLHVTQLSSSRVQLLLQGEGARTILARCAAVDFDKSQFRPGQFVMTGIHHTPVLIQCTDEHAFHIYAMRSFARAVWDWIADAAV